MSLNTLALLTALGYVLCILINYGIGQIMTERPIVIGGVIGVLLGDPTTGVIIGSSLEVVFMGIVNIGGVTATDAATSTAIATAFAIYSGLTVDEAVAVAIPIGLVANTFWTPFSQLANLGAPILDKICAKGDERGLYIYEIVMWFFVFGVKAIPVYVGVLVGADPITAALNNIPEVISTGLSVASGLLGAVGMSMLMRMLWSKESAVFFFIGFLAVQYLGLSTMAVAFFGVCIALVVAFNEKRLFDLEKRGSMVATTAGPVTKEQEEDDFLS